MNDYEMTIGIECHVQLKTDTKLFSPANNDARTAEPNVNVHPIDFGLPGMLPVLNKDAVRLAVRAAKALNADVARISRFDRKHYFYPDLPKGYQTSQMYEPIILGGHVDAPLLNGESVRVRIHHAHMEEDAGKLSHYGDYSLVDLNRAGTPLIEIVSEPDIHSAEEARAYASELYNLMTFAGITRGDLYHGNMRFDVNVSAARKGATELGTRAEIKNLNSFRSVEKAAEHEFSRQVELLERGKKVVQETRGWSDDTGVTTSQRSKEDAQDYRYMPDPDIPPIVLNDEDIASMQANFPKMPSEYRLLWNDLNLDTSVIAGALSNAHLAAVLNQVLEDTDIETAKRVFNWFASVSSEGIDLTKIESGFIGSSQLSALSKMVSVSELSSTGAKQVFSALFDDVNRDKTPQEIAEMLNLLQVSNEDEIAKIVEGVLADPSSQKAVDDIKSGNDKAIGFLVGQIMKKSQGKANPALAQKLIREKL